MTRLELNQHLLSGRQGYHTDCQPSDRGALSVELRVSCYAYTERDRRPVGCAGENVSQDEQIADHEQRPFLPLERDYGDSNRNPRPSGSSSNPRQAEAAA